MQFPAVFVNARSVRAYIESLFPEGVPARDVAGHPWNRAQGENATTLLAALNRLDSAVVAEGLRTPERAFDWALAMAAIRYRATVWESGAADMNLPSRPVSIIYELLADFPDEPTPRVLRRLPFVRDARLRRSIARDIDSLEPLVRDSEWKSATVIGGSVVEALLLDQLLRRRVRAAAAIHARVAARTPNWPRRAPPVHELKFWQMIVIAQDLTLIDGIVAGVCNGARDYRNLIHAGEERTRQPCDRGTALTAQAAVEALVQVFSGARR